MIGTWRVRSRCLISAAVWKPSRSGHLDVEQDEGEVVVQELAQRLLARVRADELLPERLQDRRQREQVLVPVVDEEDLGPLGHRGAAHRVTGAQRP